MFYSVPINNSPNNPLVAALRCPHCGHKGAFHGLSGCNDVHWTENTPGLISKSYNAGIRVCPNTDCRGLVFVVLRNGNVKKSFPPEVLDFDSTSLPQNIADSLSEAVRCHAQECYKASALMVRRVLEELCEDRKARGPNLKARLEALSGAVIVPKELIEAADGLRLLGNDAAHVESKTYDDVGDEEVRLAIDLAKELLKSVYQYSALLERLKGRQKQGQPAQSLPNTGQDIGGDR